MIAFLFVVAWINAKSRGFLPKVQYRKGLQILGGKRIDLCFKNWSIHKSYNFPFFNSLPSMVIVKFHTHLLIIWFTNLWLTWKTVKTDNTGLYANLDTYSYVLSVWHNILLFFFSNFFHCIGTSMTGEPIDAKWLFPIPNRRTPLMDFGQALIPTTNMKMTTLSKKCTRLHLWLLICMRRMVLAIGLMLIWLLIWQRKSLFLVRIF